MPLNRGDRKRKRAMEKFYGKKKGDQVFYAKENKDRRRRMRRSR